MTTINSQNLDNCESSKAFNSDFMLTNMVKGLQTIQQNPNFEIRHVSFEKDAKSYSVDYQLNFVKTPESMVILNILEDEKPLNNDYYFWVKDNKVYVSDTKRLVKKEYIHKGFEIPFSTLINPNYLYIFLLDVFEIKDWANGINIESIRLLEDEIYLKCRYNTRYTSHDETNKFRFDVTFTHHVDQNYGPLMIRALANQFSCGIVEGAFIKVSKLVELDLVDDNFLKFETSDHSFKVNYISRNTNFYKQFLQSIKLHINRELFNTSNFN